MNKASAPDVTQLLHQVGEGNHAAVDKLLPLVYDELHALAHRQRFKWQRNQTVNTTALVHEAYIRMVGEGGGNWNDRAHFFRVAARAMRGILINYLRDQQRLKRGGDQERVSMSKVDLVTEEEADTLLSLDAALKKLAALSARQSQIVECRFFAGMSVDETAAALDLSPATVKRSWAVARAWLNRELQQDLE